MQTENSNEQQESKPAEQKGWYRPQIGGLYKRKTKSGISYLGGYVEIVDSIGMSNRYRISVFPNRNKTEEKFPDLNVYLDDPTAQKPEKKEKPEVAEKDKSKNDEIDDLI